MILWQRAQKKSGLMPKFETIRRVPHSAEKMFAIVSDVERYPDFLPLIESLKIISKSQQGDILTLQADMAVGYKAIKESFRSEVVINLKEKTIISKSQSGPFSKMENRWHFTPVTAATEPTQSEQSAHADVHFSIDYKFKNWALEKLLGGMFDKAFRTYAESFENRAATI